MGCFLVCLSVWESSGSQALFPPIVKTCKALRAIIIQHNMPLGHSVACGILKTLFGQVIIAVRMGIQFHPIGTRNGCDHNTMHRMTQIKSILDTITENGVVKVRLKGACSG